MKKYGKYLLLAAAAALLLALALTGCAAPAAEVTGITVNADHAQYWYVSGAELDTAGLVVTATLSDGTTKTIPAEECQIVQPSFAPAGEKTVVVSYRGFEAEYGIFACPSATETDAYVTYAIRTNENGSKVSLTASLVGEDKPFVLIFPGGGYEAVYMRQEGYDYAAKVNELGYNAFILEYSVKMEHPAPLDDVALAYEIIEDNRAFFGVTMEDYAVCGSSAGGHLAATWCTKEVGYAHYEKPKPAACILAYAATHIYEDGRLSLLGADPTPELRKSLSADENVDADYPPTYQWVFVEDQVVTGHTELMEQALEGAGVPQVSRYFTGGMHGMGLAGGTEAEGWMEEAVRFWREQTA